MNQLVEFQYSDNLQVTDSKTVLTEGILDMFVHTRVAG